MHSRKLYCSTPLRNRPLPSRFVTSMMSEESSSGKTLEVDADVESTCASSVFDNTDVDVILNKNYRNTADWKFLQPKKIEGIYHDVLINPRFVYDIASKWAEDLLHHPEDALKSFVQFATDLCGYQNIDINETYTGNDQELIKLMEKSPPDSYKLSNKYLVKTRTLWGRQSCLAFSLFISKIIKDAHANNGLYENQFWNKLFMYLKLLASSESFIIKHTSTFIVAKFITGLAVILHELQTGTSDDVPKKEYVIALIEFQLDVVITNCKIEEKYNSLDEMKVMCIKEMKKWFQIHPDYFFLEEIVLNLLKYFCESFSTCVCEEAMNAVVYLIRITNESHFQIMLSVLLRTMLNSLNDNNDTIIVKTIEFFIELLKRQAITFINSAVMKNITLYIFNKNLKIARAAGCFMIVYLNSCSDLTERKHFYVSLIKLLQVNDEFQNLTPIFVESIIDFSPEIKMWDEMIALLLDEGLNDAEKKLLFGIMHDSMLLCITGKSPSKRTNQQKPIDENEKRKLTNFYLANVKMIAEFSWNDNKCFHRVIELLSILNYDSTTEGEISTILTILVNVIKHKDKNMIDLTCKTLHTFMIVENTKVKVEKIIKSMETSMANDIKNIVHDQNYPIQMESIKRTFLISNVFYKYFCLRELNWTDVYVQWTKTNIFNNPYTEYCLINCQHYLSWKLKHLIDETQNEGMHTGISELFIKCNQFFTTCFDIINGNTSKIHIAAFQSISDLHIDCVKKIKPLILPNEVFKQLMFKIEDDERRELLKNFIEAHIFQSCIKDENDLYEKSLDLKRYLDMISLQILPSLDMTHIFKYFHSHQKRYGTILKDALQNIIQSNLIHGVALIHKTLTEMYSKILMNNSFAARAGSHESTDLKGLVSSFNSIIKKVDQTAMPLLQLGVVFAGENQNEYYLYFLQPFIVKLTDPQKKKLCDSINEQPEFRELEPVKKFLDKLKGKK